MSATQSCGDSVLEKCRRNRRIVRLPPGITHEVGDEREILINQNAAVYHQRAMRRKCFMQGHSEASVTLKTAQDVNSLEMCHLYATESLPDKIRLVKLCAKVIQKFLRHY